MDKTSLVILKTTEPLFWESEGFLLNKVYRCLTPAKNESDDYMINGFYFTQEEFDLYFEFAYDRIMRDWNEIGFVKDGKAISFTEFKKYMNVHTYGKQNQNLRLGFVGRVRENLYKFTPVYYENKAIQLKELYERHYKETINGNMVFFDCFRVKIITRGVPLNYRPL